MVVKERIYIPYKAQFKRNLELMCKFFLENESKHFLILDRNGFNQSIIDQVFLDLNSKMESLVSKNSLYLHLKFQHFGEDLKTWNLQETRVLLSRRQMARRIPLSVRGAGLFRYLLFYYEEMGSVGDLGESLFLLTKIFLCLVDF